MESHHPEPVVYAAETLSHALVYGWASSLLKDNLYYKVVLQCGVNPGTVKSRRRGEVMVKSGDVVIRSVLLFFNCAIPEGGAKCADCKELESLELLILPHSLRKKQTQLTFKPMRRSALNGRFNDPDDHPWLDATCPQELGGVAS